MPATHDERPSVLYVSWDGLLDPLGRSQVVPYLTRLARRSCSIWVASLEKSGFDPRMREVVEAELASAGVRWTHGSYLGQGGPRAALSGARLLVDLWRDPDLRSVSILHGRGYPASAICCLLRRRRPKAGPGGRTAPPSKTGWSNIGMMNPGRPDTRSGKAGEFQAKVPGNAGNRNEYRRDD